MDSPKEVSVQLQSRDHYMLGYRYFVQKLKQRVQADSDAKAQLVIDAQLQGPLQMFVAWALNHHPAMDHFEISPRKSILLRGNVGSGKSILFRTLRDIKAENTELSRIFRGIIFVNCEEVAKKYQAKGDAGIDDYAKAVVRVKPDGKYYRKYCFDDLGNEEPKNHYGNYREVMKDIIDQHYNDFLEHGAMTCFTTNLTMPEIEKRYDKRTASRLAQMCNIIGIGSTDTYIDRRLQVL